MDVGVGGHASLSQPVPGTRARNDGAWDAYFGAPLVPGQASSQLESVDWAGFGSDLYIGWGRIPSLDAAAVILLRW